MRVVEQTKLTASRISFALFAGVLVAAVVGGSSSWLLHHWLWTTSNREPLLISLAQFLLVAIVGTGLACIPWFILHSLGRRTWRDAAAIGLVFPFVACFLVMFLMTKIGNTTFSDAGGDLINDAAITPHGWAKALRESLLFSGTGIVASLTIWQIAYRSGSR
jgi:hypothetical protein